ncbi:glucosylglycerol 3-phosphatase [Synechococcus sp. CS-1328]|uniref:glucosylglycerol 3-phosphatase n=1 Tax=Synechococcus sp. CS-1328 TaxID=2847976 RepID=UPI00223B47BF|nr:glucosylglycerol 3-phosphatase [Synechococcus sp. CS-1328]MCT0225230.1 hypothetical protein [Synechococcus sp. CS-1328]
MTSCCRVDPSYLRACKAIEGSFAVLTNGEHGGRRGMNPSGEAAVGDAELSFLERLPIRLREDLTTVLDNQVSPA